ncbi:GNAT family N-acetyltransferase [Natrialbaceae archaeon A-CW3]
MNIVGVAWENLLVGISAALLVGAIIQVKRFTYNKYLERQYPMAGEYITTWEQEIDGEIVTESAPATLTQRGKEIVGRSEMPDSDIEWIFKGEISETGYLNGLYYSANPHNTSIGNFFFHINHNGELDGLWSGYQQRNKQLNSGRYRFVPVLDAYSIHPMDRAHVPAAVDIAEQRLGKEARSAELLVRALEDDDPCFAHVARIDTGFESERSLAANLTDALLGKTPKISETGPGDPVASEVIGFCHGAVFEQAAFRESLPVTDTALSEALRHADRVGVIRMVAVKEGFENRGIGTALIEECITACIDRGATALCAIGWEADRGVNIDGIMSYFGFRVVSRVDGYWNDEGNDRGVVCESCQESPCTCPAVIYARYQPTVTTQ